MGNAAGEMQCMIVDENDIDLNLRRTYLVSAIGKINIFY